MTYVGGFYPFLFLSCVIYRVLCRCYRCVCVLYADGVVKTLNDGMAFHRHYLSLLLDPSTCAGAFPYDV